MSTVLIASPTLLSTNAVDRLQALVNAHKHTIDLPPYGRWETMTDGDMWLSVVGQVSVVGASAPAEKLIRAMAPRLDWYAALVVMTPEQRRSDIHERLRTYGIRYSMDDPRKCRKTGALLKNLALLQSHGGPASYFGRLARWRDEQVRVAVVIGEMAFIKNKGARDLLIGLGLLQDAIAFDVRVMNALKALGVQLPPNVATDPEVYRLIELELIEKVCRPSGVSGAVLDRVLYQKYDQIMPPRKRLDPGRTSL